MSDGTQRRNLEGIEDFFKNTGIPTSYLAAILFFFSIWRYLSECYFIFCLHSCQLSNKIDYVHGHHLKKGEQVCTPHFKV